MLCLAAVFVAVWFGPWCFLVVAVLLLTFCCLFAVVSLSCCCCLVAVLCTRVFAWPESYVAILRLRPSVNGKDDSIINRATATGPQHATFDLLNCWGVLVTQQSWLIVAICRKASGCAFARASLRLSRFHRCSVRWQPQTSMQSSKNVSLCKSSTSASRQRFYPRYRSRKSWPSATRQLSVGRRAFDMPLLNVLISL